MSTTDKVLEALKAGAAGAASSLFAPSTEQPAAPSVPAYAPASSGGMLSGLPSWALPAAGAALLGFVILRK